MQEGDKLKRASRASLRSAQQTIERTIAGSVFLVGDPQLEAPSSPAGTCSCRGRAAIPLSPKDSCFLPMGPSRDDCDPLSRCDDDTYVSISRLDRVPAHRGLHRREIGTPGVPNTRRVVPATS